MTEEESECENKEFNDYSNIENKTEKQSISENLLYSDNPIAELLKEAPTTSDPFKNENIIVENKNESEKIKNEKDFNCEEENNENAPISLSYRQPSFSNLTGQLIMKGSTVALPICGEDSIVVDAENNESLNPKVEEVKAEENENENISLNVRQPSFSNLCGQLVLKGSTEALQVEQMDSIAEDAENKVEEKKTNDYVETLAKMNAKRWKEMGYEPNVIYKTNTQQAFDNLPFLGEVKNRNVSCVNYYPKVVEVPLEKNDSEESKKARVLSSRESKEILRVEMPEDEYVEKECNELKEEEKKSLKEQKKENKKSPEKISKFPKKTAKFSSKSSLSSKKNSPAKNSSESFNKDILINQEGFENDECLDSEENSKIPPNLLNLVTQPKDSVVYLALCGVSIIGYQEKTISNVKRELRKYIEQCNHLNLIKESLYVQNIVNSINEEQRIVKNTSNDNSQVFDEKLEEANNEIEKIEQFWERQNDSLEAEHKLALEDWNIKCEKKIEEVNKKWSTEKVQNKFNKPSATLMEMRKTAQRLMIAKRFSEASKLADDISKREHYESRVASKKMNESYRAAILKVNHRMEVEREALDQAFDKRRTGFEQEKKKQILPIENRMKRAKHDKELSERRKKRRGKEMESALQRKKEKEINEISKIRDVSLETNKKLVLPPLNKISRLNTASKLRKL